MPFVFEDTGQTVTKPDPSSRFVFENEHSGRQIPVIRQGEPPSFIENMRDYLGIKPAKSTSLQLQAIEEGKRPFDIREEVFGTGREEEFRRVVAQGMSGLTGGLSDLLDTYDNDPETVPGTLLGSGAKLAGFLLGPLKTAQGITGGYLNPTAQGLKGIAQVMAKGGANLGIAFGLSSIIPSFMESDSFTKVGMDAIEATVTGSIIGALFPAMGAVPTKPLRIAVTLGIMDKIRAGTGEFFTIDDVFRGLKDGTIDNKELADRSFGYLMDIYFASKVPSMKTQLVSLENAMTRRISEIDPREAEQTIVDMGRRQDIGPEPTEGVSQRDIAKSFGSESDFSKIYESTSKIVEAVEPTAASAESISRARQEKFFKFTRGKPAPEPVIGVGAEDVPATKGQMIVAINNRTGQARVTSRGEGFRGKDAEVLSRDFSKQLEQTKTTETVPLLVPALETRGGTPTKQEAQRIENARSVELMFNKADAELETLRKPTLKKARQQIARAVVDMSAEVKKQLLEKGGEEGRQAVIRHDLIRGSSAKSELIYSKEAKDIYDGLDKVETKLLDRIIQSRRTIVVDKAKPEIKQPGELRADAHEAYLDSLPQTVRNTLSVRADMYFGAMQRQLTDLHSKGLISDASFENLKVAGDYSPRRFIQHIDPDRTFSFGGNKITVPDSGIKRLEEGSIRSLENNSRLLLNDVISRTQRRIARNEANQVMKNLAETHPENTIVRKLKKGEKAKAEEEIIHVVEKGETVNLAMPRDLARQWVETDPAINSNMMNLVGWLSGTKILKPMATGLNPEFALTNFPRDIGHVWLTTHEYSPHLPIVAKQMVGDFAETARDVVLRRGAYVDYINEGGGMSFLSHQGRITSKTSGVIADIQKVLGYLGETSELWTRLALRNRALKNDKPPHEATYIARNYLDFAQGGWAIKGADAGIPYLNAAVQATRGVARSAKEKPKEFAWKIGQLGIVTSGLFLANRFINSEAWEAVPDREKVNNFIITTPLSFTDDEGNRRWFYMKIAKDQPQRLAGTIFEGLMGKAIGDPVDADQLAQAAGDFLPIMPQTSLPPTMEAMLGYYANKDFWRNEDIWKGPEVTPREEYTNYTHPALKALGSMSSMSPERLRTAFAQFFTYGNIYTSIVSAGTREIMETMGARERDTTTLDMMNQTPFLRRILKPTDPFTPFDKQIKDIRLEDQTTKFKITRDLDNLSMDFYKAQKEKNREQIEKSQLEVRRFIGKQPFELQKGLMERFVDFGTVFEIPDRRFWLNLKSLSPEARATVFFTRWMQSNNEQKQQLKEQLFSISGITSERFMAQFAKLKGSAEQSELVPKESKRFVFEK